MTRGQIEVLTPCGLAFANPTHSRRMDLIYGGDFETQTTAAPRPGLYPRAPQSRQPAAQWVPVPPHRQHRRLSRSGQQPREDPNMNGFAFEIRGMIRYPSDLTAGRVTAVDNANAAAPIIITQRDITPKTANT